MKAYSMASFAEFAICLCVCFLHELLLPQSFNNKTRGEYKVKFFRNIILLAEFIVIRCFHISLIIDLFILFIIILLILPSFTKILFSQKSEFVLISCGKTNAYIGEAKYKWFLNKSQDLDVSVLKKISTTIKPNFLLVDQMPVEKIRKVVLHRENMPIFNLRNGKMEKLSSVDILKSSVLYIEKDRLKNIVLILPGNSMDDALKDQMSKHNIQYLEVRKYKDKLDKAQFDQDAIVDLTCLNGAHKSDRFELVSRLAQRATHIDIIVVTPIFCQDKKAEIQIRTYEVMLQQYPNIRILRIPFLLYDQIKLNKAAIQNWSRIDDLVLYLNYAMNIKNQKIIELNDGEYFFNQDLQKLIEEINRI